MDIGDRMKSNYEDRYRIKLTRRTPVIIRVDGKAFHTLTVGLDKPFDKNFMDAMIYAASLTSKEMQGFKMGYIQSDEVSFLLTDYDYLDTDAWFDFSLQKLVSISAAYMTLFFNQYCQLNIPRSWIGGGVFDSRAFNIPMEEVANYFLWRCKDWERNSVSMYCQSFFSHTEMMNKARADQHEMLHSIGKNWATDLTPREKNGTFILKGKIVNLEEPPNFEIVDKLVNEVTK
jgi:tRNA(His) 5'-end guanylyltransferase